MTGVEHVEAAIATVPGPPEAAELRFYGPKQADPHRLADEDRHVISSGQALRLLTRQLFAFPTADRDPRSTEAGGTDDMTGPSRPVADLALRLPTVDNGDVGEDGVTYRIRLRDGVRWDAQQAREITAGDVVRGIKRIAHPGAAAMRPYFAATIEGLADYCEAYDVAFGDGQPHAPDFAQFQRAHHISGLRAESDKVLLIRLREPANDLVDLLATGFAAAAPREYDYYVPDSRDLHRNCPSAGPYRVVRRLSVGQDVGLAPNPRWDQATDSVRRQNLDRIAFMAVPKEGTRNVIAGPIDGGPEAWMFGVLSWDDSPVPVPRSYPGSGLCPYLVFLSLIHI